MFIDALLIIPKKWKESKFPSADDWVNTMWYPYSGIWFGYKNEWNTDTCYNIDEP